MTMRNCMFESNKANGFGGIGWIYSSASLVVESCTFLNNQGGNGAVFYGDKAPTMRITNSTFQGNRGTSTGGAITINAASAQIISSDFISNTSPSGGALEVFGVANVTISSSLFESNTATSTGGAITIKPSSSVVITNTNIRNNVGRLSGGLDFASGAPSSIVNCTFYNNSVVASGGTIDIVQTVVTISGSNFTSNTGVTVRASSSSSLFLSDTTFSNNKETKFATASIISVESSTADMRRIKLEDSLSPFSINVTLSNAVIDDLKMSGNGGPLKVGLNAKLILSSSSFVNNSGGAVTVDRGVAEIDKMECNGNSVTLVGKGACVFGTGGSNITINLSSFTNNNARLYGGAVASEGLLVVRNSRIESNTAARGGGIWVNNATATALIDSVSVVSNFAGYGGGIQIEGSANGIN